MCSLYLNKLYPVELLPEQSLEKKEQRARFLCINDFVIWSTLKGKRANNQGGKKTTYKLSNYYLGIPYVTSY